MAAPKGKLYRVNASAREGFIDRRRAGEAWPRGAGNFREVFVVKDDEDPAGRKLEDGTFAIGQKTFEILKKDPEIFIDSADRTGGDAEVEGLRARVTTSERRVVELEAVLAKDPEKAAMKNRIADLEDQIEHHDTEKGVMSKHIAELEALIAEATKPATPSTTPAAGGSAQ